MKYQHGGFVSAEAEFGLRGFSRVMVRSGRNQATYERVTLSTQFEIFADTQAAIAARYSVILGAFRIEGNIGSGFLHTSGGQSAIWLGGADSINGVTVTQLPGLEPMNGADYISGHLGSVVTVQADYPISNPGLLDYRESLTLNGNGGREIVGVTTDVSIPYIFETAQHTLCGAEQIGQASAFFGWPLYNPPIFDASKIVNLANAITYTVDDDASGQHRFITSWKYRYLSDTPLDGRPLVR